MPPKSVSPQIHLKAFDCPHCGAYTTQHWYSIFAKYCGDPKTINVHTEDFRKLIQEETLPLETKQNFLEWCDNMDSGLVFFEQHKDSNYLKSQVHNLYLSSCYNCENIAVWVHDKLIFPPQKSGAEPNPDLPKDILNDYEEARSILNLSPRGAAALLRLCVQKLCFFLGESGKNVDQDIASLVSKGLNPLVQKSLDIVRVIGNEAVHPGTIDLRDDRATAISLFSLINTIIEQMVSVQKHVEEMYEKIPQAKREAIESRNEKAKQKPK